MSKLLLTDSKIWFAEYDVSGDMNSVSLNYSADMQEDTTFSDDTHVMKGGLKSATMGGAGFFSAGTDEIDPTLFNNVAVIDNVISISPTDGSDGERAFTMPTVMSEYKPGASVGDMFAFTISAEASSDGLIRGTVMHNASRSSSGDGSARQLGALSASQTMYAALHVLSGSGTLDVDIYSDDNAGMTSEVERISFTQATAKTFEWKTLAGAVTDDYWRVKYTIGSGTWSFIVILGIK
jgi:hypothetical protein